MNGMRFQRVIEGECGGFAMEDFARDRMSCLAQGTWGKLSIGNVQVGEI